jgi:hypothetical protein
MPQCSLSSHKTAYELKLFAIGLTSILFKSTTVNNNLKQVIDSWPMAHLFRAVVLALTKQQRLEQKKFTMQQIRAKECPKKKKKEKADPARVGLIS